MLLLPVVTLLVVALEPFLGSQSTRLVDLSYKLDNSVHSWFSAPKFENQVLHNGTRKNGQFESW